MTFDSIDSAPGTARVRLAPGARPFLRAPDVIQFGADATRTGMITTPFAEQLVGLLDAVHEPATLHSVEKRLAAVLGETGARSLIADLASYRLLIPVLQPTVLVLGHDELTARTREIIERNGVTHRRPVRNEAVSKFLNRYSGEFPLAVVNTPQLTAPLVNASRVRPGPVVPVTQLDARVVVGPVCGQPGPCVTCAHLYMCDRDPNWPRVAKRVPLDAHAQPLALHAGAAAAALLLCRLAGIPDPPGVSAPPPAPGTTVVVDPYAPQPVRRFTLGPHPDCPECF